MRTIAILPVKPFDAAKQRLGGRLGRGTRRALAEAMVHDVLTALRRTRALDAVAVVTAEPLAEALARSHRMAVLHDPAQAGQSAAAAAGIAHALDHGFDRAVLVPGDTPLLDPRELDGLLDRARRERLAAVIVPDRHGTGTNALVLTPPDVIEPSFGPGSLARHVGAAEAAGVPFAVEPVPSLGHDVDTADDLADLAAALGGGRGGASLTRGAIRQLDRSERPAPPPRREPEPARGPGERQAPAARPAVEAG